MKGFERVNVGVCGILGRVVRESFGGEGIVTISFVLVWVNVGVRSEVI